MREFKTNREKAEYIREMGFSNKEQTTLERKSSDYLDKIIELEREPDKEEYDKEAIDATRSLIEEVLDFLDAIKREREGKGISGSVKAFIIKNSENTALFSKKVSGVIGICLLATISIYAFLDAIFGARKIKEKAFEWVKRKRTQ